jgi:hypothetical protein
MKFGTEVAYQAVNAIYQLLPPITMAAYRDIFNSGTRAHCLSLIQLASTVHLSPRLWFWFNLPHILARIFIMDPPDMDYILFILQKSEREQAELLAQRKRHNRRDSGTSVMLVSGGKTLTAPRAPTAQSPSLLFQSLVSLPPPIVPPISRTHVSAPQIVARQSISTSTSQITQNQEVQQPRPTSQPTQSHDAQKPPPPTVTPVPKTRPQAQTRPQRQRQTQHQPLPHRRRTTAPNAPTNRALEHYLPPKWRPFPPRIHTYDDDVTHYYASGTRGWEANHHRRVLEAETHVGETDYTWAPGGGGVIRDFMAENNKRLWEEAVARGT